MQVLRELFRRGPSRSELLREPARRVMDEAGGRELMIRLATELRQNADRSAIVDENKLNFFPDIDVVTLRFELQSSQAASSRWQSKAVRIMAYSDGRTDVQYGDGWRSLHWPIAQQRRLPKPLEEMSLEEQVRYAMDITGYSLDFRYGEGNRSAKGKPVKSSISRQIF